MIKRSKSFFKGIPVAGFEKLPRGKLLSQFVDFAHPVGAAYERCIGYFKGFHTHDRINLSFPRASSIIEFKTKNPQARFKVEEKSFLWMPANVDHSQDTLSTIYDNLAIFPSDEAIRSILKSFSKRYGVIPELPKETVHKTRSALLGELLNEYFLERVLESKPPDLIEDLSRQILEEVLRILICPKRASDTDSAQERSEKIHGDPIIAKAVRFLEAHLFESFSSKAVADYAGTSPASLFRKFKAELEMTPGQYTLSRRMDEALALIKIKSYTASDVGLIVGYADLPSFSKAFKTKFGVSPSLYLKKQPLDFKK